MHRSRALAAALAGIVVLTLAPLRAGAADGDPALVGQFTAPFEEAGDGQCHIDAGYRDELKVLLVNLDPHTAFDVQRGDRIAQLVVQAVAEVRWSPVVALPPSERGAGGFGHTGR